MTWAEFLSRFLPMFFLTALIGCFPLYLFALAVAGKFREAPEATNVTLRAVKPPTE
jgi:hypothetical protein